MQYIIHVFLGVQVTRLRADGPCASVAVARCMKKYPATWQRAEDYKIIDASRYLATDSMERVDAGNMKRAVRNRAALGPLTNSQRRTIFGE